MNKDAVFNELKVFSATYPELRFAQIVHIIEAGGDSYYCSDDDYAKRIKRAMQVLADPTMVAKTQDRGGSTNEV